jgi:FKBP-type peptidyl-prolyl cis-trans isomerase
MGLEGVGWGQSGLRSDAEPSQDARAMHRRFSARLLCLMCLLPACNRKEPAPEPEATAPAAASPPVDPTPATAPPRPPGAPTPIPAPPDVGQAPADAEKTPSGLATRVLTAGSGTEHPGPTDTVSVHYTGWTTDGTMFDSSVARGRPTSFRLNQVIPGWTEGLQLMVAGEKRRLWIPGPLAYGDVPKRPGAPAGNLVFDVELLEIVKAPEPPKPPPNLKKPPATAKKTASGLVHEVLVAGTGEHPKSTDYVVVHYTGWTTDGEMFDSSVTRGQPAVFRLDQVIKGWTEGVQLMKVGGRSRLYIPGALAYGDKPARPGAPAGPLVFEIELREIKPPPTPRTPGQSHP